MKIYQESQHDDKGNEHPTPKIGCGHDNLRGNEAYLFIRNGERDLSTTEEA
jgi:hypothetical protein